jgi:di/tricarboxylate transporter
VISPLSPATISVFMTVFGGTGIITTTLFHLRLLLTLPLSLFAGFAVAGAVLLPAAVRVGRDARVSPSKLLIPLSFGTLVGGMALTSRRPISC